MHARLAVSGSLLLSMACHPPPPTEVPAADDSTTVAAEESEPQASAGSSDQERAWADRFEHGEAVTELSRSEDGRFLVSRGDTTVKLWDAHGGALLGTLSRPSVTSNALRQTAVSAASEIMIATGLEGGLAFEAMSTSNPSGGSLGGPKGEPCGPLAFSTQGTLAIACAKTFVHLLGPPFAIPSSNIPTDSEVMGVTFSPDGSLLAMTSTGGLTIVRTDDGSELQPKLAAGQKIALGVRFTPDGTQVVVGWHTGLNVYDVATKAWVAETRLRSFPEDRGRHLDVSPTGEHVIIGGELLRMKDVLDTKLRHQVPAINAEPFTTNAIFAGDGHSLYLPAADGSISRIAIEP